MKFLKFYDMISFKLCNNFHVILKYHAYNYLEIKFNNNILL